eukprot:TRINITY_DN2687_c0_g1_i2.p1 TRINITY_DN2687_c0_g1~~TRINITY_DN2687_c0_g1_i2.p1  ORF type:complete len:819 (-),score=207.79 TRINITY_DN2687_c0_g1_i2:115-2490(-)
MTRMFDPPNMVSPRGQCVEEWIVEVRSTKSGELCTDAMKAAIADAKATGAAVKLRLVYVLMSVESRDGKEVPVMRADKQMVDTLEAAFESAILEPLKKHCLRNEVAAVCLVEKWDNRAQALCQVAERYGSMKLYINTNLKKWKGSTTIYCCVRDLPQGCEIVLVEGGKTQMVPRPGNKSRVNSGGLVRRSVSSQHRRQNGASGDDCSPKEAAAPVDLLATAQDDGSGHQSSLSSQQAPSGSRKPRLWFHKSSSRASNTSPSSPHSAPQRLVTSPPPMPGRQQKSSSMLLPKGAPSTATHRKVATFPSTGKHVNDTSAACADSSASYFFSAGPSLQKNASSAFNCPTLSADAAMENEHDEERDAFRQNVRRPSDGGGPNSVLEGFTLTEEESNGTRTPYSNSSLADGSGELVPSENWHTDSDCRHFRLRELKKATNNFGMETLMWSDVFGSVYRGFLHGCEVTIKRLHASESHGMSEFRNEVEVLGHIRHPHIVLLMGHCPEDMSLVYEHMGGGTLQRRLVQEKAKSQQLLWMDRLRILCEVVSALVYLHQHDPSIVHGNLRASSILLDSNGVCKVSDVGVGGLLSKDFVAVTGKAADVAGYVDPEEAAVGGCTPASDVYALGLVALQLLTGQAEVKEVHKLLHQVRVDEEGHRDQDQVVDVILSELDVSAGAWPKDLAEKMAAMAARCVERQSDLRPSLTGDVLQMMEGVKAELAKERERKAKATSSIFICPLSKERMKDPVVAADGFTYERKHIEEWFSSSSLSPMTGEKLENTSITPNHTILSLIYSLS